MGMSVTGVAATLRANGKAKAATNKTIVELLEKGAHVLLRESQKLVPVDTRMLKDSGHVEVSGTGMAARASVVYDTPYAIYVHEMVEVHHEPPTQARYLADAVPRVRGTITAMLKRQVAAAVRGSRY